MLLKCEPSYCCLGICEKHPVVKTRHIDATSCVPARSGPAWSMCAAIVAFKRLRSEETTGPKFCATSMPPLGEGARRTASSNSTHSLAPPDSFGFPLVQPPPSYNTHPAVFQVLLVPC